MESETGRIASQVPFHDFACLCEKICKTQGKDKKKEVLRKFLTLWRDAHQKMHGTSKTTDSFFPVLRFLLPHLDKDRLSYGMKEVVLAKYYIEVLNISKESDDAKRLLNYRAPTSGKQDAGDFASVAYVVLKNRCPEKGHLTVDEINQSLDEIADANTEKKRDEVKKELQKLIRSTSALEQKWLIRIIIKDMKLGLNENSIFPVFHPEAQELYNVCNSLSKVCFDLHDPSTKLNEMEITLLTPFRPMLGQRSAIDEVEKLMGNGEFVIETKIDGERMQLHKSGDEYRYFSRNSIDYTQSFGTTKYRGTLTPFIASAFKENVNACILDGEMVGYDSTSNDFVLKGSNIDIKSENFETGLQPCFVVFDILMVNDEKLANVPLYKRIHRCDDVFNVVPGRLQLVERKIGRNKTDVVNALNKAIDKREEGIVIKNPLSLYKPSKRKGSGWLKLKPEYVDSLSDELDLLILGGQYGSGYRRGGVISHFLLGVADSNTSVDGKPKSFLTLGKVGSGYSDKELNSLLEKLNKYWRKFDSSKPPFSIQFSNGFKEKPDVWIEPEHSVIVQVKASEITVSEKYKCGCTLRFPRVEKIRDDKDWYDCMNYEELQELRKIADGRLTYKLTSGDEPAKKKRRVTTHIERSRSVAEHFKGACVDDVKEMSKLLEGKQFCVINGSSNQTKQDLEKKIVEHGGTFVQNPSKLTFCVIAEKSNVRVKTIISRRIVDVVRPAWLFQCFEKQVVIPYQPGDMLYTTEETLMNFRKDFDHYGDSYTKHTCENELLDVFSRITNIESKILTHEDMVEIENRYFEQDSRLGIFRRCRLYVAGLNQDSNNAFSCLEFKFHGGFVSAELDERTTHLLVNQSDVECLSRSREQVRGLTLKPRLITSNWIRDCLKANQLLHEGLYEPT